MEKYAQISLEKSPFEKTVMEKTDNIAYNYLMLIEGVNTIKAHTICKHLKLKTLTDLLSVSTKQLVKVPGIGPITAQKIITNIKN